MGLFTLWPQYLLPIYYTVFRLIKGAQMCGIGAYLGKRNAQPTLIEGLKRLEYRGYDSAGLALLSDRTIKIKKTSGRITALEKILDKPQKNETLGIAHTRWATHGRPNTTNAHPHLDYTKSGCL